MKFNNHSNLAGMHAFLSPSQPAWLNYDDAKLERRWITEKANMDGTEMHELAEMCIKHKRKMPENTNDYFDLYVNDAIGFGMKPEVVLFYSPRIFGTADAIKYDARRKLLRIHDLKNGTTKPHREQLEIYAALFCLEYDVKPSDINFELRIYQKNKPVDVWNPGTDTIFPIMDKIISHDITLQRLQEEEI